ncbi:MAG TPA: efflux RND transporter periplasmic adaptor subunit [Candidatus Marinimicrobia bacterium]|nr:efflux RND transporter periplasmic adaptor subunit [Candidatus Neomarinimicrobiota bacterium]
MKKIFIIFAFIGLIALIVFLNLRQKNEKPVLVETRKVTLRDVEERVTASGRVQPVTQVNISANVAGEIVAIYVKEGHLVQAGQILAQLDKVRYEADVRSAESNFNSRKISVETLLKEKKRSETLFNSQNLSEAELDRIVSEYELAQSQLDQAKAYLEQARDNLSKTVLKSPINGQVIKIRKEAGEIALGSQFQADVIMILADLREMEVEVEVNESDVVRLSLGDPVDIEIDAIRDTVFKGELSEIAYLATSSGIGTQESVTNFQVVVKMLNIPSELRPGMSATVEILTDRAIGCIAVPIQAVTVRTADKINSLLRADSLRNDENINKKPELKEIVFVVRNDSAIAVPVKIGLSGEDYFQILEGIQEGDEIVVGNHKAVSRDLQDANLIKRESDKKSKKKKN